MKNTVGESGFKEKVDAEDASKLETAVQETITWLDASQAASTEEYKERQKELEGIANPIMTKFYSAGGAPGGAPGAAPGGFPGAGAAPGAAPGAGGEAGPTVEEVD